MSPVTPSRVAAGWLIVVIGVSLRAPAAHAGACPSPQVRVHPDWETTAPTNVLVRLDLDDAEVEVHELLDGRSRQIRKTGHVRASAVQVEVRPVGGAAVPVSVRRPGGTRRPLILVSPRRPLAARTRHEVVVRSGADAYVVSRFTTDAGPVTTPPTIGTVATARAVRYPEVRHWKDPAGSWLTVTLAGTTDAVAVEVHELAAGATPSDATLRAVVPIGTSRPVTVRLNDGWACHGANFSFPRVPAGARTFPLRLGLRALDAAGHASPAREVVVDLARRRVAND